MTARGADGHGRQGHPTLAPARGADIEQIVDIADDLRRVRVDVAGLVLDVEVKRVLAPEDIRAEVARPWANEEVPDPFQLQHEGRLGGAPEGSARWIHVD